MKNELSAVLNNNILSEPGDDLYAYVTPTGRQVVKVRKHNGKKASATRYKTGKTVYTFSS